MRPRASLRTTALVALLCACGGEVLSTDTTRGVGSGGADRGSGDASPSFDASPRDAAADASSSRDAARSTTGSIYCGDVSCDIAKGEVCCQLFEPGKLLGSSCTAGECTAGPGQSAMPNTCDGPEDCLHGDICCAYRGGGAGCDRSERCNLNTDDLQLCHKQSDCAALPGSKCCIDVEGNVNPGYCRDVCP